MPGQYDIIRTRRSEQITAKLDIYKLLDDSYRGGYAYKQGNHLNKYPREWSEVFKTRQERAIYFNYLQPIVDILAGFIFKNPVERKLPPDIEALKDSISKGKGIDQYMHATSITSLQYTLGILVDSPAFDSEQIKSEADRRDAGINPYCCTYYPYQIRDFACNEDGDLIWVLLDDTKVEKDDPFAKEVKRTVYRLWTATYFQDFEMFKVDGKDEVLAGPEIAHPVGYVPFHFVNWRDVEDDHISDSPMEDIALLSAQIYNILSLLDEMLHTGTFSTLFFPVAKSGDIDDKVKKEGLYDVPLVEFNGALSQAPFYGKPGLSEVEPFISALKLYVYEIFRKIGMDVDRDKSYVQSGAAMGKEFQKTEALLRFGAQAMQDAEEFIFRTMSRWLGKNYDDSIEITYSKEFQSDDVDLKLKRLYDVFNLGLRDLKELSLKEIISMVLPKADAETLSKETEGNTLPSLIDGGAAAEALKQAQSALQTTQNEVKPNG